ncbi:MAG: NAD(P)-dependent oxidoreductase, partial [Deltaproteobacteria bacterium]|nr:NAD(P)-dependent oxidoreductase [Deltaproteobacteria bacterium]
MSRVLATGSAGAIGSSLVPALEAAGFEVVRLDHALDPSHDLVSGDALPELLRGCEGVVHLAACARVGAAERDPASAQRDNVDATAALLAAIEAANRRPWLVFTSSREVYGEAGDRPVTEDSPLRPRNAYGRTKADAEGLVHAAADRGLAAITLRLGNVYGSADDHPDRLVPAFVAAAVAGEPLVTRGRERTLDLVHARDVDAAIVAATRALQAGETGGMTVNICSGVETAIGALAERVVTLAASRSPARHEDAAVHEVARFVGDNELAGTALGWSPRVALDVGLVELVHAAQAAHSRTQPRHGARMKILQVIHGYPMRYNAGSEVYTQTLAQGLAAHHDV